MKQQKDNSQWDNYWAQGNIHSLTTAFSGNYAGAIEEFWKQQFSQLPDNAVILDVGTGNGGIAFIAAEVSKKHSKNFKIHAMDLADIDPAKAAVKHPELEVLLADIEFLGKTSVTELPYENQYFDFIMGQYSLEYTPVEKSLLELRRVLKAKGKMAFLVHHQESVVMATTKDELVQAGILFDKTKLFIRARSLVKAMGENINKKQKAKLKQNPVTEKKRNALNQAFATVDNAVKERIDGNFLLVAMDYIKQVFMPGNTSTMKQKLVFLQQSQQIIKANQKRLEDLYSSCFTQQEITQFIELCSKHHLSTPHFSPFYSEDNHLLAWKLLI